ncbi:MAG TPA: hypothetical protein VLM05_14845 [Mycobacteriales bacterium]|nr:hypothetical protein [Mycobacteriales bacterium]
MLRGRRTVSASATVRATASGGLPFRSRRSMTPIMWVKVFS